jgi:hypothetical protein
MERNIRKFEYQRVLKHDVKLILPEQPVAWEENNFQIMTLLLPQWKSFQTDEETGYDLHQYKIIRLEKKPGGGIVRNLVLVTSQESLEDILMTSSMRSAPRESLILASILYYIAKGGAPNITVDLFKVHYNTLVGTFTTTVDSAASFSEFTEACKNPAPELPVDSSTPIVWNEPTENQKLQPWSQFSVGDVIASKESILKLRKGEDIPKSEMFLITESGPTEMETGDSAKLAGMFGKLFSTFQ